MFLMAHEHDNQIPWPKSSRTPGILGLPRTPAGALLVVYKIKTTCPGWSPVSDFLFPGHSGILPTPGSGGVKHSFADLLGFEGILEGG